MAFGWLVGIVTAVVPALMPETFEGSGETIVAYLEERSEGTPPCFDALPVQCTTAPADGEMLAVTRMRVPAGRQ